LCAAKRISIICSPFQKNYQNDFLSHCHYIEIEMTILNNICLDICYPQRKMGETFYDLQGYICFGKNALIIISGIK